MAIDRSAQEKARGAAPEPKSKQWRDWLVMILATLWPILLLMIGIVVKLALVDEDLAAQQNKAPFVVSRYGPDMWVEILIASWISAANTMASKNLSIAAPSGKVLTFFPLGVSFACVVWLALNAKLGPMGDWIRIWIPAIGSLICLAVVTVTAIRVGAR